MERVLPVSNETRASCVRVTKAGRKLTYKLSIQQQPERARACGSGAKSSADRRPVDPPPIVQLKIFEGETDVTFNVNANYFLFATLEQARPIAQGRVQQDNSRLTVLTGTPVAGLVYLDRPEAAGYFLFPDLSVRHEGKYRLSFNLYEELKESQDEDQTDEEDKAPGMGPAHVTHRLEVKSKPFTVYSAKKFPGLKSSTDLSRLVAEQGCRVRIRRDVRVRKHGKDGKDFEGYDDGAGGEMYTAAPGDRGHLPHRQRSSSVDSHQSIAPALSRRSSEQELASMYQRGMPPNGPATPQSAYAMPYGQAPTVHYQPPHYQPVHQYAQSTMPPPSQPRQAHAYQPAPPQPPQAGYHAYPGMSQPAPPPSHHAYENQYHARNSVPEVRPTHAEYRSAPPPPPPAPQAYQYPPTHNYHAAPSSYPPSQPTAPAYHTESSRDVPSEYSLHQRRPSTTHKTLPALNTGMGPSGMGATARVLEPSSPCSSGPSPVYSESARSFRPLGHPEPSSATNGKRSYGQVFDTQHMAGPMRAGARPVTGLANGHMASLHVDPDEAAEDTSMLKLRMSYKRADGRQITKALPPHY